MAGWSGGKKQMVLWLQGALYQRLADMSEARGLSPTEMVRATIERECSQWERQQERRKEAQ